LLEDIVTPRVGAGIVVASDLPVRQVRKEVFVPR
jgi:hypothetical protein